MVILAKGCVLSAISTNTSQKNGKKTRNIAWLKRKGLINGWKNTPKSGKELTIKPKRNTGLINKKI